MDLESLAHANSPRRRYGQLSTTMAAVNRYGQLPTAMASCKYFVRRAQLSLFVMVNSPFFPSRHGELTLLAAPKLLNSKLHTAAAINSNDETEQKDHHLTTSYSYSQAQAS
jgi:hypothetical protein